MVSSAFSRCFFGDLVLHGAHIVQPVTDLDEDDPDVLGHGQQHFAQILHLLLLRGWHTARGSAW